MKYIELNIPTWDYKANTDRTTSMILILFMVHENSHNQVLRKTHFAIVVPQSIIVSILLKIQFAYL